MPSLRLLTRPAWLTLDRLRSRSVVRQNTSRGDGMPAGGSPPCERRLVRGVDASSRGRATTERASPTATKATPR